MTHRHFLLHKPFNYLSQFVYNQTTRKNKKRLGELYDFPEGTMSIGRLDEDSEGLLLLTTDGVVSAQVRSKSVEKEYYVQVDGIITPEAVQQLQKGVEISIDGEKYQTLECKAYALTESQIEQIPYRKVRAHRPTSWVSITIVEGKFRQVRKMTAAVGFPTLRLVRVRIGHWHLGQMETGAVVEVEDLGFG